MPFFDLDNYLRAAQAVLQGRDLYALRDVYYPLPLYLLFLPLVNLPLAVAHWLWSALEAIILVALLRRRALVVLLFMPVLLSFLMGQIVIPLLGLFALLRNRRFGGLALALLLLKPQLVFFVAPWLLWRWWRGDRRQLASFALTLALLALTAFALQPDWLPRWLATSGQRMRAPISPSIWGVLSFLPTPVWLIGAGVLTASVFIWAWRKYDFDTLAVAGFLANPVIISYDLTLLTLLVRESRVWFVLIALSWLAFGVSAAGWVRGEAPTVVVTVAGLLALYYRKRKTSPLGLSAVPLVSRRPTEV